MTDTVSRAELAEMLGLSEARVQQLTTQGVLKRRQGRYEPLPAALAVVGWLRRDEATKAARLRLMQATAMNGERRVRQHLRKLLTVAEVREVFAVVFEASAQMVQAETSRFHNEIAAQLGTDEARKSAYLIYNHLRRLLLGFRNGSDEMCRQLELGLVQDGTRLDALVDELRRAVADRGEPDVDDPPPAPAARKRRAA